MLPNLKQLRAERGISQQKLADILNFTQQSINQYENHNIEPDLDTLSRMADYFETSIDYIVGRTTLRRPIEHTEAYHLNDDESGVMERYRALTPKQRQCVQTVIDALLEK